MKRIKAIALALLAAVFYAINTPLSKVLLETIPATFLASFLYLGAGIGVGIMYLFHWKDEREEERLQKEDSVYTIGMIVLDILAPIFLMFGIRLGSASNASLLGNFEIVATTLIALLIFHEEVSNRLWAAIVMISLASVILSFDNSSISFSSGSLFVLLATICWGLENNCTRKISEKSTYQIVVLKGIFSGIGSFLIAVLIGETLPHSTVLISALLLGFVAYGLSIFVYIRAQRTLGAAKTSAYYAVSPFIAALLSFILVGEKLSSSFLIALLIMIVGTAFVVLDTLVSHHVHEHEHIVVHTHDGSTHSHVIKHVHGHDHYKTSSGHAHHHRRGEINRELEALHSI